MVRVQACLRQKASDPGLSFVGLETSRGTDSHNPTRCPNLQGQQRLVDLCSIHPCLATKTTVIWAESFCTRISCFKCCNFSFSNFSSTFKKRVTLWKNKQPILHRFSSPGDQCPRCLHLSHYQPNQWSWSCHVPGRDTAMSSRILFLVAICLNQKHWSIYKQ